MALPEINLLSFCLVLYINFQLLEKNGWSSLNQDDVIDWPLLNKFLGCATGQRVFIITGRMIYKISLASHKM